MASGDRPRQQARDVDPDEVDITWLIDWARRHRVLPPPRGANPSEQLVLFGPAAARPRSAWFPVALRGDTSGRPEPPLAPLAPLAPDFAARFLLIAAISVYVAVFLKWTLRQQAGLGTQAFDLGIFDQGVWLLSRLKEPFVTINGRNLFGDHTVFILLPFAVVYRLIPSPRVLLVAQTLALGLGAWPAFLIARHKLRNEMFAAIFGIVYLIHPVVGWANLSEGFHPDAFEIPLVLLAFWFVLDRRWVAYGVCVVALLLTKEDVAFLTFGLGVYVALRHDERVGKITCAVSAAYLVAAFWVIIPAFLGSGTVYSGRIPFGGPTGYIKRALTHPGDVFSLLVAHERLWYLWQLVFPVALVATWAPAVFLVALGPLALNLITGFPYQFDVRYHYSTLILPVIIVATIFGVAAAPQRMRRAVVGVVLATSLWSAYLWSPTPIGRIHPFVADPTSATVASFRRAEKLLPPNAVVSSFYGYVPQIAHREEIYMFPNPWKASYWGTFKQEGQRLPRADRVQYVIVPSQLAPDDKAVLDSIRGEFETAYEQDGILLLKRR